MAIRMNRTILSWCLYDLANTIFAMNMTSYYFPVWVVVDRGGTELAYSLAFGLSMFVSALFMPRVGADSDRSGGRIPALIGWTLGCIGLTAALGSISHLPLALIVFAGANFCYQLAGIFYNALLPFVSPSDRIGKVSGYGVALGYVGTLVGILATTPIAFHWGRQATFLPTALLFLILSLPCFFWVKDTPLLKTVSDTVFNRVSDTEVRGFLLASFWGLSAVSTVILFMSVYAKQAIGFNDATLHRFLLFSTGVTIVGSLGWGWLTDRIGGYRTLGIVWALWAFVFALAAVSRNPILFWGLGSLAGVALGGTWVASRVLLVEWVGPERVGEAFGQFGLVSRLSSIPGPVVWGLILWGAAPLGMERYRLGMAALLGFVLVGGWLYFRLSKGISDTMERKR